MVEPLEGRQLMSASHDLVGLTALRADPQFAGIDGTGMSVAVIDTGVDVTHPLIAPNYLHDPQTGALVGQDFYFGGNNPIPVAAHGTHVAGIIGATDPEIGMATDVNLIGLQVFTPIASGDKEPFADLFRIEKALRWVLDHQTQYNIVAVNMSLGGGYFTDPSEASVDPYADEIRLLEQRGVVVVSAAGNSFDEVTLDQLPPFSTGSPGILSTFNVGAVYDEDEGGVWTVPEKKVDSYLTFGDITSDGDRLTFFSQRPDPSRNQTILAPGAFIESTIPGGFDYYAGTSMAAPMVAGAVALVQEAAMTFGGRLLSVSEVQRVINATADLIVDGDDEETGLILVENGSPTAFEPLGPTGATYRRLNVGNAVREVKRAFATPQDQDGTIASSSLGPSLRLKASGAWSRVGDIYRPVEIPLTLSGRIGTDGSVNVGGKDVDMYSFRTETVGSVSVTVSGFASAALRIFDGNGQQLASGNTSLSVSLGTGTYYAAVSGGPNRSYDPTSLENRVNGVTGSFQITFGISSTDADSTFAGATDAGRLSPGTTTRDAVMWRDFNNDAPLFSDRDMYRFEIPDSGVVTVSAINYYRAPIDPRTGLPTTTVPVLATSLFDENGESLASLYVGGAATLQRGTYYVRVFNTAGNPSRIPRDGANYGLSLSFAPSDADGSIPQLASTTPISLTVGQTAINQTLKKLGQDGQGPTGIAADVDLVRVRPLEDGVLSVDVGSVTDPSLLTAINHFEFGAIDSTKSKKFASGVEGSPSLSSFFVFGASIAPLGDLDGDGITEIAVGVGGSTASPLGGCVYILFLNADRTVKHTTVISSGVNGGPTLSRNDAFGSAVTSLGDIDRDGVTDIAVGAPGFSGTQGKVCILFLRADGTVKSSTRILQATHPIALIEQDDRYGSSLTTIGDLDGDGVNDLAVGAPRDLTVSPLGISLGSYRGSVSILFLNQNGSVKGISKIASGVNGGPVLPNLTQFGTSVTPLGDLDNDGVVDLAVGGYSTIYTVFMNRNGTVKSSHALTGNSDAGPILEYGGLQQTSLAALGDQDGDGITELLVGSTYDDTAADAAGAVYVVHLNADGSVKRSRKIASDTNGGPTLASNAYFGGAVASLGDIDADGAIDVAIGASGEGAVHLLSFTTPKTTADDVSAIITVFDSAGNRVASDAASGGQTDPHLRLSVKANEEYFIAISGRGNEGFDPQVVGSGSHSDTGYYHLTVGLESPSVLDSLTNDTTNSGAVQSVDVGTVTIESIGSDAGLIRGANDVDLFQFSPAATGVVQIATSNLSNFSADTFLRLFQRQNGQLVEIASNDNVSATRRTSRIVRTVEAGQTYFIGVNGSSVRASAYDPQSGFGAAAGSLGTYSLSVQAIVNDFDPAFTSANAASVSENSTAVLTVSATDMDQPTQKVTLSIVGGADQAKFSLASTGELRFVSAPDIENPTDADRDNIYEVQVQADDGYGRTTTQTINVSVTGMNEFSPVFTSPTTISVPENSTAVRTVTATDADLAAQTMTFSIVGGADQAKFSITSDGVLTFVSASDFENPTDSNRDNVYVVQLRADDGNGKTTTQTINVNVTGINDNSPVFISSNLVSVPENISAVRTVTASDADFPTQSLTYSVVGGTDQAKFAITTGGVLTFKTAPDFESPADANGDNVYEVQVQASDGTGGTTTQTLQITVTAINDNTPAFTSPSSTTIAENSTSVLTVTATDADLPAPSLTFSIVGGADQAKFNLTSGGVLTFKTAQDFDNPADANRDNIFVVQVQVSDGNGRVATQTLQVSVSGVNDNSPVFTSSSMASVAENTTAVQTVIATDADLPTPSVTFSIVGGADQAKFSITSGGLLTFVSAPDFENPTDADHDNAYFVQVQASDGDSKTTTQTINVTVVGVNDNTPVFTSPTLANVAENTTSVLTVLATDADRPEQTVTYSIVGGADQNKFQIVAGVLSFKAAPDFENPTDVGANNVYEVQVQANDGEGGRTTQAISVTVTDVVNQLVIPFPTTGGPITVLRSGGDLLIRLKNRTNLITPTFFNDVGSLRLEGSGVADSVVLDASLVGYVGTFQFNGGDGNDSLDASKVNFAVTMNGGQGNDVLIGGGGNDVFLGDAGKDSAKGFAGADLLEGGDDNDNLDGGVGNDTLTGNLGDDVLTGGGTNSDPGADVWAETVNGSITVIATGSSGVLGKDSRSGIEGILLTGGSGADLINASAANVSVTLVGGAGDDSLTGGTANDVLQGGADNDSLIGGAGNDRLEGQDGDDALTGGAGTDILNGGAGTDRVVESGNLNFTLADASLTSIGTGGSVDVLDSIETAQLTGGSSANTLDANGFHQGSVTLSGGAGKDILIGTAFNDLLNGGADDDQLRGGAGDDFLTGEAGKDTFDGGADTDRVVEFANVNFTITAAGLTGNGTDTFAADTVSGGSSIEEASLTGGTSGNTLTVNGFAGRVTLDGAEGNDVLIGGANNDSLDGGDGTDVLTLNNVDNIVLTDTTLAGAGNDTLYRIEQVRIIVTLAAQTSVINASEFSGAITVTGSNGDDDITTGAGNDSILGGLGHDDLHGGSGLDTIDGGAGNDCLHGDAGNDKLLGSIGNDTIRGGLGEDSIDGGADDDVLLGEDGNDTILGGIGDLASDPAGSRGDDILIGGDGNDSLSGQDGNDTILGGQGADKLFGGNGNDTLAGDEGKDTLAGDAGTDVLFGGPELDSFTAPAAGEKNEDGLFTDAAFFDRLDLMLAGCP